ncbi:hypothetical protein DSO57_1005428 [Entomophthora muscae]|uniref:Uncharacterized protein n=1 Tax=Entomophthora muscae TaxID=34485 RepID=A0ACC2TVS0_9FUNG|nr:hypothetical protein DSO57_1005428 [Entomophthora muscae]
MSAQYQSPKNLPQARLPPKYHPERTLQLKLQRQLPPLRLDQNHERGRLPAMILQLQKPRVKLQGACLVLHLAVILNYAGI